MEYMSTGIRLLILQRVDYVNVALRNLSRGVTFMLSNTMPLVRPKKLNLTLLNASIANIEGKMLQSGLWQSLRAVTIGNTILRTTTVSTLQRGLSWASSIQCRYQERVPCEFGDFGRTNIPISTSV